MELVKDPAKFKRVTDKIMIKYLISSVQREKNVTDHREHEVC